MTVTVPTNNQPADGSATNQAQALVTDANNQPLANVALVWTITGSTTASATTPLSVTTNSNGIATLNLTDTMVESVTVTATAGGKRGQNTATFTSVNFGPVTLAVEHTSTLTAGDVINRNVAMDGVDITVNAYPGMAEGDQITTHFKVTGDLSSSSTIPLPDVTFPVHTVTAQEVGQPLTFTVDAADVMGAQSATNELLQAQATALVVKPSTAKQITGTSPTYGFDTQ